MQGTARNFNKEFSFFRAKRDDRIFSVKFSGESSIDAGGPFRAIFDDICREL
jgi:hypothetical protein